MSQALEFAISTLHGCYWTDVSLGLIVEPTNTSCGRMVQTPQNTHQRKPFRLVNFKLRVFQRLL